MNGFERSEFNLVINNNFIGHWTEYLPILHDDLTNEELNKSKNKNRNKLSKDAKILYSILKTKIQKIFAHFYS